MSTKFLKPSVTIPTSYGLALLNALVERGMSEADLLKNTHLDRAILQNQLGRIALLQYRAMFVNARQLQPLDGLAYELGLRSKVIKHGFVGYGPTNCANLREAFAFNERHFHVRLTGAFIPHVFMDDEQVVISLRENMLLSEELCNFMLDMVMIELCSLFAKPQGSDPDVNDWTCEIWAPYAEPAAYARYRTRLPRFHFNKPAAQIRFPSSMLDEPIASAHSVSRQPSIELCELEMLQIGTVNDFSALVLAHIVCHGGRYRVRRMDSENMLANPAFSIKQVAIAVGYADSSNFARAVFKWTGCSPKEWRRQRGLG